MLRTDGGGEYTSARFEEFLKCEGIRHERTIPRTPEQNGVAERMNRTLVETVRSMLSDSKLPQKFWAEALSTAVYLRNRSPAKAVRGTTPFEAWTSQKPTVGHLRVFGSDSYAHIPKEERKKLDFKARKCVLLGMEMKRRDTVFMIQHEKKIFFSRNVVFDETKHAIASKFTELQGVRRIEVDVSSDDVSLDSGSESESEPETDPAESATVQPPPRRSMREKHFPDYFGRSGANLVAKNVTKLDLSLRGSHKKRLR